MEKSVLEQIVDPPVQNRYNMTSTSQQYPAPKHGGSVPNIMDVKVSDFPRMSTPYVDGPRIFGDQLKELTTKHVINPLNSIFFSQDNVEKIQKDIHDQVAVMSGGKYDIGPQSDDDLKLIMRSYYLMFGTNNPGAVAQELSALNSRVVGYAAAKVYSEVDFHMFYLKDVQDFAPPIANPMNVHQYGTRVGELTSFF